MIDSKIYTNMLL